MTCPGCRHVVDVPSGQTIKCHNCRTKIAAPSDFDAAHETPAPSTPPPTAMTPPLVPPPVGDQSVAATMPLGSPDTGDARTQSTAGIVTLVFGLLFFIPFITQVIALVVGCFALVTRKDSQRTTLVWVGMTVAALALIGWVAFFGTVRMSFRTTFVGRGMPYAQSGAQPEWERTDRIVATMERVQRAALAYHRDFGEWPDSPESLAGHRLPQGFKTPEDLTYRPVPATWRNRLEWVLIVSSELTVDREGEALREPHRLLARLDGSLDLLPAGEVNAIVASQPSE